MRLRGTALGFAFTLGVLLMGTRTHGAVAPLELAFVSADGGVPQIFTIRADGSGRRRLTNATGPSTMPVWSHDGQKIAFVRRAGDNTQIYTMNADGGSQRPLTAGAGRASSPAWSPDGRRVVFAAMKDGVSQVGVIGSNGTGRRDLAPSQRDQRAPAWSPDGRLIAFLSRAAREQYDLLSRTSRGHFDLYVVGADGQNLRQVPTPAPGIEPDVKDFAWLPDGHLAYTCRSGPAQDGVSVTTVTGTEHRYLGTGYSSAWAPDSHRFAVVVSHSGAAQIYVLNAAGGHSVRLVDSHLISVRPAWSPDGRRIAFLILGGGKTRLAVADPDGQHQRQLADDVYGDLSALPVFSWRPR